MMSGSDKSYERNERCCTKRHFNTSTLELWRFQELFYFFVWRDMKARYKRSFIGILWVVVKPLFAAVVLSVVYHSLGGRSIEGIPYILPVFLGLLFWNMFSTGVQGGVDSLSGEEALMMKIYFPRVIIPLALLTSTILDFLCGYIVFVLLLSFYHIPFNFIDNIGVLFVMVPFFLLTSGISLLLSLVNTRIRDVSRITPFLLQLLFFATPVAYTADLTDTSLRFFQSTWHTDRACSWRCFIMGYHFFQVFFIVSGVSLVFFYWVCLHIATMIKG